MKKVHTIMMTSVVSVLSAAMVVSGAYVVGTAQVNYDIGTAAIDFNDSYKVDGDVNYETLLAWDPEHTNVFVVDPDVEIITQPFDYQVETTTTSEEYDTTKPIEIELNTLGDEPSDSDTLTVVPVATTTYEAYTFDVPFDEPTEYAVTTTTATTTKAPVTSTTTTTHEEKPPFLNTGTGEYCSDMNVYQKMLNLLNNARAEKGLKPLWYSTAVHNVAQLRTIEISNYYSHTRPNGEKFATAFKELGVNYRTCGENIAYGRNMFDTVEEVFQAWMDSPSHYENIMNENYECVGFGLVILRKSDTEVYYYWSQEFAKF